VGSKSGRSDFSLDTRRKLAARSGYICSNYGCANETVAPTTNGKGEESIASIGIAAHINAAAEKGPRPGNGMSSEELSSVENGIWMCRNCAGAIDDFRNKFPVELLLEMKTVREFSQNLAVVHPKIRELSTSIPKKNLDEIVRGYFPEHGSKVDEITKDVQVEVALWELFRTYRDGAQMPLPPNIFALKPLVTTVACEKTTRSPFAEDLVFRAHRTRAVEITSAIHHSEGNDDKGDYAHTLYGVVLISARNPQDGAICSSTITTTSYTCCSHSFTMLHGEVIYLGVRAHGNGSNGLRWHLDLWVRDGRCRILSYLHPSRYVLPKPSDNVHDREAFESYARVLDYLAAGWEPIAYVGTEPTDLTGHEPSVHPDAFSIENRLKSAQLDCLVRRSRRVQLGYELADELELPFIFSEEFFHERLDEKVIWEGVDQLMQLLEQGPDINLKTGPLVMLNESTCINLKLEKGQVFFQKGFLPRDQRSVAP